MAHDADPSRDSSVPRQPRPLWPTPRPHHIYPAARNAPPWCCTCTPPATLPSRSLARPCRGPTTAHVSRLPLMTLPDRPANGSREPHLDGTLDPDPAESEPGNGSREPFHLRNALAGGALNAWSATSKYRALAIATTGDEPTVRPPGTWKPTTLRIGSTGDRPTWTTWPTLGTSPRSLGVIPSLTEQYPAF
jgi:hypothetical protein